LNKVAHFSRSSHHGLNFCSRALLETYGFGAMLGQDACAHIGE